MAKKTVVFRLTVGDLTPSSWELPQRNVMGEKKGVGQKFINYYPGEDSVFDEDIYAKNKDIKSQRVPTFTFNKASGKTELEVEESNVALITYLKTHPWFGKNYEIFSTEETAKGDLKRFDNVEKALNLVSESDTTKTKAIAMAIFGLASFYKTETQCAAELKAQAVRDPDEIIRAMEATDYETKYLAGLALVSGELEVNNTHTALVWKDTQGVILHIAQGENGLDKLSRFLRNNSKESEVLLQELESRLNQKSNKKQDILKAKDEEIAQLRAMLDKANSAQVQIAAPGIVVDPTIPGTNDADGNLEGEDGEKIEVTPENIKSLLQKATTKYEKQTGGAVPTRYKNDLDWINSKLT